MFNKMQEKITDRKGWDEEKEDFKIDLDRYIHIDILNINDILLIPNQTIGDGLFKMIVLVDLLEAHFEAKGYINFDDDLEYLEKAKSFKEEKEKVEKNSLYVDAAVARFKYRMLLRRLNQKRDFHAECEI